MTHQTPASRRRVTPIARFLLAGVLVGTALPLTAVAATTTHGESSTQPWWNNRDRFEEERVVSIPHIEQAAVDITTRNGSVEVIRTDAEEVTITATVRGSSRARVESVNVIVTRLDDSDTLQIEPDFPDGFQRGDGVDIRVEIPDAHGVKARSSNGSIKIEGLSGHADLHTSNGSVKVFHHAGDVGLRTSNGRVDLREIHGTADVRTSNGRVTAIDLRRDSTIRTSNGRIEVDTSYEFDGRLSLDTSNGTVRLGVGPHFSGEMTISTSNGSIGLGDLGHPVFSRLDNGQRKTRASLRFGDASQPEHRLDTSNGSVVVRDTSVPPRPEDEDERIDILDGADHHEG